MAKVRVKFKNSKFINFNPSTYYSYANVYKNGYCDTAETKTFSKEYPFELIRASQYKIEDSWQTSANVADQYFLDLAIIYTLIFNRYNSNIYKNIFENTLFDLYSIQNKIFNNRLKQNTVFQYNHGLNLYDLVYLDNNGIYKKGLAIEGEKYNVCGMVSEIINENEFILTYYGKVEIEEPLSASDSSILYLSDTEEGKFCIYEDITSTFYTPIGFYIDGYILVSILDSSYGFPLHPYEEFQSQEDITYLTNTDVNDIIQQVINNA